jgi:hypothetical protein
MHASVNTSVCTYNVPEYVLSFQAISKWDFRNKNVLLCLRLVLIWEWELLLRLI